MSPVLGALGVGARSYGLTAATELPGDFELIETNVLASAQTSVTFSAISSVYKHLRLQITARSNAAAGDANIFLQFNGDTGSNYKTHHMYGGTSAPASFAESQGSKIYVWSFPQSNETAGYFAGFTVDILDVTSTTKNKTTRSRASGHGSSRQTSLNSGVWMNTAAITSIAVNHGTMTQSFAAGCRFSLYGFRG